jgi:type IV fimbrial biogenesis protein FimT
MKSSTLHQHKASRCARARRRLSAARAAGLTLIELLTAMAIASILTAIAVPSFKYVTTSNRITSEVNALLVDMQYAHAEAIREGQTVTICSSTDGATCSGSTTWNQGWLVFSDVNNDGTVDAGDTVWRVQKAFASTDSFVANNGLAELAFNREGFSFTGVNTLVALHDSTNTSAWTHCVLVTSGTTVVSAIVTSPYVPGTCT